MNVIVSIQFIPALIFNVNIKGEHLTHVSSSIMHLWKLSSTILIFTLVTGIVHSMLKGKPNTFWSKRTGQQDMSDQMHKDESQYFSESQDMSDQMHKDESKYFSESKETERISKLLRKFRFRPFSAILHKIQKYYHFYKESTFDEILLPK